MATESGADKAKKKHFIKRIGGWFKATFMELRKVSWPTFKTLLKQTGVVFAVTIFFLLVLMGMDLLLQLAYRGLVSGLGESTSAFSSALSAFTGLGL